LGQKIRAYAGLEFRNLTFDLPVSTKATLAINNTEKYVLAGSLSFERQENSYRYENEGVVTLWSREPPVLESRAYNDGYFRVEIPVPLVAFSKMCELGWQRTWAFMNK
jgi:hypothetical protein